MIVYLFVRFIFSKQKEKEQKKRASEKYYPSEMLDFHASFLNLSEFSWVFNFIVHFIH